MGVSHPWPENWFVVLEHCKTCIQTCVLGSAVTGGGGNCAPGDATTSHDSHHLGFPLVLKNTAEGVLQMGVAQQGGLQLGVVNGPF